MSAWETLGLPPGSDRKAIKKAYAKLLKENRPDEDLSGFQRLYEAYQEALEAAKAEALNNTSGMSHENATNEPFPQEYEELDKAHHSSKENLWISHVTDTSSTNQHEEKSEQASTFTIGSIKKKTDHEEELSNLRQQAENLANNIDKRYRITSWKFIAQSPYLLDSQFNRALGEIVFGLLLANKALGHVEMCLWKQLNEDILIFLNETFSWTEQENSYMEAFESDLAKEMLEVISRIEKERLHSETTPSEPQNITINETSYHRKKISNLRKTLATILDICVFSIFAYLLSQNIIFGKSSPSISGFIDSLLNDISMITTLVISYFIVSKIMLRSTPGKWLSGYQVHEGHTYNLCFRRGMGLAISFFLLVIWLSFIRSFFAGASLS